VEPINYWNRKYVCKDASVLGYGPFPASGLLNKTLPPPPPLPEKTGTLVIPTQGWMKMDCHFPNITTVMNGRWKPWINTSIRISHILSTIVWSVEFFSNGGKYAEHSRTIRNGREQMKPIGPRIYVQMYSWVFTWNPKPPLPAWRNLNWNPGALCSIHRHDLSS